MLKFLRILILLMPITLCAAGSASISSDDHFSLLPMELIEEIVLKCVGDSPYSLHGPEDLASLLQVCKKFNELKEQVKIIKLYRDKSVLGSDFYGSVKASIILHAHTFFKENFPLWMHTASQENKKWKHFPPRFVIPQQCLLATACKYNNVYAEKIIAADVVKNSKNSENEKDLVLLAAGLGSEELMQGLLDQGWDINATVYFENMSVFDCASAEKHRDFAHRDSDFMKLLCAKNAKSTSTAKPDSLTFSGLKSYFHWVS